jgi:hypothetical protein
MPLYNMECQHCFNTQLEHRSVAEYKSEMKCSKCGTISTPKIIIDKAPNVNLFFPGSCTHSLINKKMESVPEERFIPDNGKDTVPGPRIYDVPEEKRYI